MEWHPTKELIDKYFEAKTTLNEEQKLKEYFTSNHVAENLQEYIPLFSYFSEEGKQTYDKKITLPTKKSNKYFFMKIAAGLLLPVFMLVSYQKYQEYQAEKIYNKSKAALQLLASNLQKGNHAIAELQNFETTKNKIFIYKK